MISSNTNYTISPANNNNNYTNNQPQTYADQLALDNPHLYPIDLKEAVSHALLLGVLKPTSSQEPFGPAQPITYAEFRQWTLDYQTALYGTQALPNATTLADTVNIPTPKVNSADTINAEQLSILPEVLEIGKQIIQPNQPLTREAFCYLYFVLRHQEKQLSQLPISTMEAMTPNGENSDPAESLSQFKDYANISPWARPAVALLYQKNQLQPLFRKTPAQLTLEDGLGPKQPTTRAEAIVLLHWIYGSITPQATKTGDKTSPIPALTHASLHIPDYENSSSKTPLSQTSTVPPVPFGQFKSLQESSSQGKRQFLRIDAAD